MNLIRPPRLLGFLATLLIVANLEGNSFARTLPLLNGGTLSIPDQLVMVPLGVLFVRPGEAAPVAIPWTQIDLPKLAQIDPELELLRRTALAAEKAQVAGATRVNLYAQFLNSPFKVTFRTKETHQTKVQNTSVSTALPFPSASVTPVPSPIPGGFPQEIATGTSRLAPQPQLFPSQVVNNTVTTRSDTTIDQTRPPLDTTVGGFLELISDYTQISVTGNLVRELREQPHLFTNVVTQLRALQNQFPQDSALIGTSEALQKLAKNGPVSIDAQMAIKRHLITLRARADSHSR